MDAWLGSTEYAFTFFGAIGALLVAPWVALQYRRFGHFRGWPALVSASIVLYVCALVAFTLFPLPNFEGNYCAKHASRPHVNLQPLASLDDVTAYAADHSLLQTLTSGVFLQVFFNVAFFVPLGIYVSYRYRRGIGTALLASLGVSLAIETTQGTGIWGLAPCVYRMADVDDIITNTSGGLIGWFIGLALVRILPDARPVWVPDDHAPTRRRRALGFLLDLWTYVLLSTVGVLLWSSAGLPEPQAVIDRWPVHVTVTFILFVILPLLRRDRAGPGRIATHLALVRTGGDGGRGGVIAVLVRWGWRWLPYALFGFVPLVLISLVDVVVAGVRRDRRSLIDLITGTKYVTRQTAVEARLSSQAEPSSASAESSTSH
jgi:glycopeptide antibiotics resistance protein